MYSNEDWIGESFTLSHHISVLALCTLVKREEKTKGKVDVGNIFAERFKTVVRTISLRFDELDPPHSLTQLLKR